MEDFGKALRRALDETVGPAAKRKEVEEGFLRQLAERKSEVQAELKRSWRGERVRAAARAEVRVREYARALSNEAKERLSRDERMPVSVNYLERYSAMKAIQDRSMLLARIEQTIGLAESAAGRANSLDVQGAISDAAESFRGGLQQVSSIIVGCASAETEEDEAVPGSVDRASLLQALDDDADSAFSISRFPLEGSAGDVNLENEREAAFEESLSAAKEQAESAHRLRLAALAKNAAGASVMLDDLPEFGGKVECMQVFDPEEVQALVREVRDSFSTYRRVVQDNGLFAAFSEGSLFGRCVGRLSWYSSWDDWSAEEYGYDDTEYTGDVGGREFVRSRIPSQVEDVEDEGDSLPTVISRMREFNERKYFGMLDDDFKRHVDAFWYGYGKLMEFANGMFEVDLGEYVGYCKTLVDAVATRCGDLAMRMGNGQLKAYCDALSRLRDAVAGRG